MASASSQRQSVVPLMVATSPRANTSSRKSDKDHRASGTPASIGSSHAIRLISTTTLGGKAGWAPASRLLIEAGEAFGGAAVAPIGDDLLRGMPARRRD